MTVLIVGALMAFGGYLITIPRLLYDEWSFRRARKSEQSAIKSG